MNRDASIGQWWGAEFALSRRLFDKQTFVAGSEYRNNFQQFQTNYDEQPYQVYFASRRASDLWAVYAQDAIRLRSNVTLDLGLRHDQYSTFGGATNPRAALLFQPFQKTTLKLLYGQSFRAPNAYELYYAGSGNEGNLQLRPETVKTTELILEQYLQGGVRLLVSGYYYPIRGLISQETDLANGNTVYENAQQVNLRGAEMSLNKQLLVPLGSRSELQLSKCLSGRKPNAANEFAPCFRPGPSQRAPGQTESLRQHESRLRKPKKNRGGELCRSIPPARLHPFQPRYQALGNGGKPLQCIWAKIRRSREHGRPRGPYLSRRPNFPAEVCIPLLTSMKTPRHQHGGLQNTTVGLRPIPRWYCCLAICGLLLGASPQAMSQGDEDGEYAVKLAFLYNFTQFVQWPAETFRDPVRHSGYAWRGNILSKARRSKVCAVVASTAIPLKSGGSGRMTTPPRASDFHASRRQEAGGENHSGSQAVKHSDGRRS